MTGRPRIPTGDPERLARPHASNPVADQWTPLGPAAVVGTAAAGRRRITGRFRAIAVSPDGQRVYAGSAYGGVWFSGDGGEGWKPLDFYASTVDEDGKLHHADALTVGAIGVRWGNDAGGDVVYLGPGERTDTVQGTGIRVATGPATAAADPWRLEATDLAGVAVSRLLPHPATGVVWAATTLGLHHRATSGRWDAVDTGLGTAEMADVAVAGGRVYVATADGRMAHSTDGVAWQQLALPGAPAVTRVRLAAGSTAVWVLADSARLWRVSTEGAVPSVQPVGSLPPAWSASSIVARGDEILIGGGTVERVAGRREAAFFRITPELSAGQWTIPPEAAVGAHPTQWVGAGIPGAVHAIAWNANGHVWTAGDAGLFRSTSDAVPGAFGQRNTGLDTIEPVALAESGGVLLVGTRSSGVLTSHSGEAWRAVADGTGGVAVHPGNAHLQYAQIGGARWQHSTDGGRTWAPLRYLSEPPPGAPAEERAAWADAHRAEDRASAPVSRAAVVANDETAHGTQVALGTDRVWYTDDALGRWVTLPNGSDPFAVGRPDTPKRNQDRRQGTVLRTVWGTPDQLYVLASAEVCLLSRNAQGAWQAPAVLYDQAAVRRNRKGKVSHGQVPDDLPMLSLAVHRADIGLGTLYLGTSGPADEQHLWWFDGDHTWLPAELELDSPIHAIAVDPQNRDVVYVGTDAGVWKGIGTFPAPPDDPPQWQWSHHSGNLPEASCVDLLVSGRMLCAALAGRGVWQVSLDGTQQGPQVYLRSHPYDGRRSTVDVGGPRDPHGVARHQVRLDASPDIHVTREPIPPPVVGPPQQPPPPPEAGPLPIQANSDPYDVWRLLAAMRKLGDDLDPEAGWSPAAAAALAARAAALPPIPSPRDVWRAVLAGNPFPFDLDPPDHADLALRLRDEPDRWPKDTAASCASSTRSRVRITVHTRHWTPVAAGTVHIALLRTAYGRRRALGGTAPLPADWAAQLLADRNGAQPPAAGWLGPSWSYAEPAHPFRTITGVLDPLNPQTVTFDVDLADADWDTPGHLLLAVVLADSDPLVTNETDVAALVRGNHRVAARSVRNARVLAETQTVYAGMDIKIYPTQARMGTVWRVSNFVWTGLYLDSPLQDGAELPPHSPGHNRKSNHPAPDAADAWMRSWPELRPMWGIMPIYWGQQVQPALDGPYDPRARIAVANAQDASVKAGPGAGHANLPPGAVIYLDYEAHGAPSAAGLTYMETFLRRLAELGYRPGAYCRPPVSAAMRGRLPHLYVWNVKVPGTPVGHPAVKPWRVRNGQLIADTTVLLTDPADSDAVARQWIQDTQLKWDGVPDPPKFAPEPHDNRLRNEVGALVGNPAYNDFVPDLSVSSIHDPAFPERRNRPDLIRVGRVAVTTGVAPARAAITAIRRGRPTRSVWSGPGATVNERMVPSDVPHRWNPFSTPAAVKLTDHSELFLALAYATAEGDAAWRVQALRQPVAGVWRHETIPDSGLAIDPLPGVVAVNRWDSAAEANATEVFVLDDDSATIAGAHRAAATGAWSTLARLHNAKGPITPPIRRTNRPAAVSRTAGVVDLFTVDTKGMLWVSHSPAPGEWRDAKNIGGPTLRPHPIANLVAVSSGADRIDLLFIGADLDPTAPWWPALGPNPADLPAGGPWSLPQNPWRLYNVWWTAADEWGDPPHAAAIGGAAVRLDPHVTIGAVSRRPGEVQAYASGLDTHLYTTSLANAAWTVLGEILRPAPAIASIDGVCSTGPDDVEVVVTGRDGNVYATHWDTLSTAYSPLEPMRLNLA